MTGFPDPFEWHAAKSGKLLIYRNGVLVTTISGDKAAPIIAKLGDDENANQQILARATGNYRRGNERLAGSKRSQGW
ncbi:MAG: hypothetical protein M9953_14830 [Thermomicrobiales bacterium]|nr:hypothetical protein [Thermomicrobiales bacterium]MCO5226611.1 hypothetical protein [Thermomicrobiales bacterium]MCO5228088.1 hypothetical protein [Thermomicrobiales bacterium]